MKLSSRGNRKSENSDRSIHEFPDLCISESRLLLSADFNSRLSVITG